MEVSSEAHQKAQFLAEKKTQSLMLYTEFCSKFQRLKEAW